MKWNSLLSESSRYLHQEMDIWKKPQRKQPEKGFSPSFHILRLPSSSERERISCFSLGNTSMMTLQTIPGVRGRITSNFGCWIQNELFPPLLFARRPGVVHCCVDGLRFLGHPAADLIANLCEESRSLLCCVMHLGKRKCFVPPPQKRSEKRRKNTPSITMRLGAPRSSLNCTLHNEYGVFLFYLIWQWIIFCAAHS